MNDNRKSPALRLNRETVARLHTRTGLRTGAAGPGATATTCAAPDGPPASAACLTDACASADCGPPIHGRTFGCMH